MNGDIQSIVIMGATGKLGSIILQELLHLGYSVSILTTRAIETVKFPENVMIMQTDYSEDSLIRCFTGQDAVVSTIAFDAVKFQHTAIDAAAKVGVKRFIPSEFCINTPKLSTRNMKWKYPELAFLLEAKNEVLDHLRWTAEHNPAFTWTCLATGPWTDLARDNMLLSIFPTTCKMFIYDTGHEPFNATNLPTIALAVGRIFRYRHETTNKYLQIDSFRTSQNILRRIVTSGPRRDWSIAHSSTATRRRVGNEKLFRLEPFDSHHTCFLDFMAEYLFADFGGNCVDSAALDNDLLRLGEMDEATD